MRGGQRCLHILLRHDERNVALRGAMCNSDRVHLRPSQRAERAAHDSGNPPNVLADNRDDCHRRVDADVFHLRVSKILCEFAAEVFNGALGHTRRHHQAYIVLRRGLGDQQNISSNLTRRRKCPTQNVWDSRDGWPANCDYRLRPQA
jgi:hypothetical protein